MDIFKFFVSVKQNDVTIETFQTISYTFELRWAAMEQVGSKLDECFREWWIVSWVRPSQP